MIRVRIAGYLIEQMLTTGSHTQGKITVVEGVPPGAHLAQVHYDAGSVYLYFTEQDRVGDLRDVEIVLRSDS